MRNKRCCCCCCSFLIITYKISFLLLFFVFGYQESFKLFEYPRAPVLTVTGLRVATPSRLLYTTNYPYSFLRTMRIKWKNKSMQINDKKARDQDVLDLLSSLGSLLLVPTRSESRRLISRFFSSSNLTVTVRLDDVKVLKSR